MAGFIGVVGIEASELNVKLRIRTNNKLSSEKFFFNKNSCFFIQKHFRFERDYILSETDEYIVCFHGVIINSSDLLLHYKCNSLEELIFNVLIPDDLRKLNEFNGNYAGFIYDKNTQTVRLFTNHFSQKSIFYYLNKDKGLFVFSTHIESIIDVLKQQNLHVSCSEFGAFSMLTFGYMLRDQTVVAGIKKMLPATIITVDEYVNLTICEYYKYNNTDICTFTEDELLQTFYSKLNKAFKLGFLKDNEYNYDSFALLSGGLDSRLISFAAKKFKGKEITNLSFGQSMCDDVSIAQDIASGLNNKFIFVSLDGGNFLKEIDANLNSNFGGINYISSAHGLSAIDLLNLNGYGLLHNGNLADISHGDYISFPYHTEPNPKNWASSLKLYDRIQNDVKEIACNYNNDEHFSVFNRGINGILSGGTVYSDFTDTYEPYMYPDLVNFASTIPPKYKFNERLFLMMIKKYYPEAIKIDWARWNMKPKIRNLNSWIQFYIKIKRRMRIVTGNYHGDMNPFDEWMQKNASLKLYWDMIYNENINLFNDNVSLKNDMKLLYNSGNYVEKAQVITLLKIQERLLKL